MEPDILSEIGYAEITLVDPRYSISTVHDRTYHDLLIVITKGLARRGTDKHPDWPNRTKQG